MVFTPTLLAAAPAPVGSPLGFMAGAVLVGVGLYLVMATILYLRYYVQRRGQARAWKCQPDRFPTSAMTRYDFRCGLFNLTAGSLLSGFLSYLIASGRFPGGAYLQLGDGPLAIPRAILSGLLYFLGMDLLLYTAHRLYHRPALFRAIHRHHHRNTTPTPFTTFSMHPVEFLTYESLSVVPLLFLPVYAPAAIGVLLYSHFTALVQHSGIHLRVPLWLAPASLFHDDHHRHFHVNYGQNLLLWDRLFGTLRRKNRRYGVEVFGGHGAPTTDSAAAGDDFIDYYRSFRVSA